ncbi:MAG: carbohydrate ABC transporter substrate-binding protein [Ndongobacter sp.]|nr:carbohydrate ABC transporter substrate-binding protein [Ndongobacter sp.]
MKLKKIAASLMAALMVLSLAACGGNNGSGSSQEASEESKAASETTEGSAASEEGKPFAGQTLKVAGLDGGYGTDGWKAVIAGFEELTGAKVEYQFEKNIAEVIRPQIAAGEGPDVIYNSIGGVGGLTETMIKEEMLLDISDVFEMTVPGETVKVGDKLIGGFLDTYNTKPYGDGKVYLAPLFYSPTGLWYNKAMFKENGGKYELPTTFDQMLALGEQARADGVSLLTYPTAGYFDGFTYALINEVGGTVLFNKLMNYDVEAWKSEATPVFEIIGKLGAYLEPNTVAQANGEGFTKNQFAVMQNKALFMPNGNWIVGEMADALSKGGEGAEMAEGFEWGYMALPAVSEGGDRYAYTFFEQCFVSKDAKNADLAKAFIAYLYSDAAVKAFYENGNALQPVVGAEEQITDPLMKAVYGVYATGAKPAMGGFAAAPAVEGVVMSDALFTAIDSVMSGAKTAAEWQQGVVDAAQALYNAVQAQ